MDILKNHLPKEQYINEVTVKNQFCLHHTVSWSNDYSGDFATWNNNKERVATPYIIELSGRAVEVFPPEMWAHHLYVQSSGNKAPREYANWSNNFTLNKYCFGIEIDSAGPLIKKGGKFYPTFAVGVKKAEIPKERVQVYKEGFRGYKYYEKYSPEQIATVKELILEAVKKGWVIKDALNYGSDIWDLSIRPLKGEPGIFTHVSYRTDKSDCHPQPELIEMLEGINSII